MGEVKHKLSQFADDTTLILDGSEGSFRRAIEVLDGFQVTSGLKVTYENTKVLWVGSAKNRGPIECNKPDISWVEGKVFALGVWFATDRNEMLRSNYDERIGKIKNVMKHGNLGDSHYWEKNHSYQKSSGLPTHLYSDSTPYLYKRSANGQQTSF